MNSSYSGIILTTEAIHSLIYLILSIMGWVMPLSDTKGYPFTVTFLYSDEGRVESKDSGRVVIKSPQESSDR